MDASIFIVWHVSADVRGVLPQVLNKYGELHAAHGVDMEPIKSGRIYVAPPDFHLLIEKDVVRVTHGPKENRFRPAVDPLFRSAAYTYGSRVIGVVLSGALDDGSAGLWTVKEYGGVAVVQDPSDAEVPSMPENAMRAVDVDYKVPIEDMAELLVKLSNEYLGSSSEREKKMDERTEMEIKFAMEEPGLKYNLFEHGELTPYTCPECHGVLTAIKEGKRIRFRCHTGHAFSADSLLATITESIEDSLWNAIRSIQESVLLLNHMGDHFAEADQPKLAAMYFKKAKEAQEQVGTVRQAVLRHERLSGAKLRQETELQESRATKAKSNGSPS